MKNKSPAIETLNPDWLGGRGEDGNDEIYREHILDHYRNPRNSGKLKQYTLTHKEHNPLCGDEIQIYLLVKKEKISSISFEAKGCAISVASMSLLSEWVKHKSIKEIKNLKPEKMLEMLGIKLGIVRMKCGLLGLKTILNALERKNELYH
ncbi:MAG: iron-sulfur cluster assembly scaffold protein [Nanoarchaeota archaeon]